MQIAEFLWDDTNEAKVVEHDLEPDEVDSILERSVAVFRNRRDRRGEYVGVGRSVGGRWITVSIERVPGGQGLWRPVTAWPSKKGEITLAQQQGAGD